MGEIKQALRNAAELGYEAAENGENLDEILDRITVKEGAEA